MLAYLIQGIAYGFAAAVTPGPLSMYLISQAAAKGWRRALPIVFSPLLSDGPIAFLILGVLSRVPSKMVLYLRLLGGFFILYLAYGAWKSWRVNSGRPLTAASSSYNIFKAALINWLNPNPYIGWSLIMGPILLNGWRENPARAVNFLLGFYVIMLATMIGIVFLFAGAGALGPRVRHNLIGLSAVALACFGLYQIWMGGTPLLPSFTEQGRSLFIFFGGGE
jgi:threonine/homoserine/homoserine lactone efflux protein